MNKLKNKLNNLTMFQVSIAILLFLCAIYTTSIGKYRMTIAYLISALIILSV